MSDGDSTIPLWLLVIFFLLAGAYFAGAESAFAAVNKIKVKSKAEEGNKRAKRALYILNHFEKALTTLLVGNNITHIAAASVATIIAARMFAGKVDGVGFTVACTAASTAVIFLFSEMIPKSFANDRAETLSLSSSGSLIFFMRVLTPISAFFGLISKAASRLFAKSDPSITEDELADIFDTAEEEGVMDEEQNDILQSALEFDETLVRDVMTMARDVDSININASTEEILAAIRETNHSRIPVFSGAPDHIVGVLRIRRYLAEYRANPKVKLRAVMAQPYFVREDAKIDDVLSDMRQHKHLVAIVADEQKKMVGLVTVEDFLEELVGEIFDEDDVVDRNFQPLGGNKYLVSVNMLVGSAFEKMGHRAPPRGAAAKPILSLFLEKLGHLPREDETFLLDDVEFTASEFENEQLTRAELHILDDEEYAERTAPKDGEEVGK